MHWFLNYLFLKKATKNSKNAIIKNISPKIKDFNSWYPIKPTTRKIIPKRNGFFSKILFI